MGQNDLDFMNCTSTGYKNELLIHKSNNLVLKSVKLFRHFEMSGFIIFIVGLFALGTLFQDRRNGTYYEDNDDRDTVDLESCEENEEDGIFGFIKPFSCCGQEKFKIGLNIENFYKNCSTIPQNESEPFHTNYWRVYECLVTKSVDSERPLDAYNFADMMMANLSLDKKTRILFLIDKLASQNADQTPTFQIDSNSLQPQMNMEHIVTTYLLAKYQICNGYNDSMVDESNSTFVYEDSDISASEIFGDVLRKCRNHTYPSIPLFPMPLNSVQKCVDGERQPSIFNSLQISQREILCGLQQSSIISEEGWNDEEMSGMNVTDLAPPFYSNSVLNDIELAVENLSPNLDSFFHGESVSNEDQKSLERLRSIVRSYMTFKNSVNAYCMTDKMGHLNA